MREMDRRLWQMLVVLALYLRNVSSSVARGGTHTARSQAKVLDIFMAMTVNG